METRTYTVTINAIKSNTVNYSAWIDDGWISFKAIRFTKKNKQGMFWNFNNSQGSDGKYYARTKPATFLERGLNYAMERLVELKDGLTFTITVADDDYERPVVSDISTVERKSNSNVSSNDDAAALALASELLN